MLTSRREIAVASIKAPVPGKAHSIRLPLDRLRSPLESSSGGRSVARARPAWLTARLMDVIGRETGRRAMPCNL
jgi:hypothetical protein